MESAAPAPTPALRTVRAANASPMTLDGSRTFVLGRARPVVIDPGPDQESHLAAIGAALAGASPVAILLTHAHPDHAAAAPPLARRTAAPVLMARGALAAPFPRSAIDRWLADGERIETDAGPVRALATPGHAPEHLAFHWTGSEAPPGGALFVGDLLMGEGDTTLVAHPEGDLADYLRSLERVERTGAGVLYPTHGPPLTEPALALARYRAHRRQRIEQVRDALAARPAAEPDELLELVYGAELAPALREAAAGSIRAILEYLGGATRAIDAKDHD